ncbi:hypothetical protein AN958_06838 [Leucoagaricus sp. SymC.cos]|nr:hypothetical protein AN958_06838 [Leucoagaricus sp. SymC.cos]
MATPATADNGNTRAATPPSGSNQRGEHLQVPEETPRIARSSGDKHTVTDNRNEIAKQMEQEMLTCPLDGFQNTYLPFVPSDADINKCTKNLVGKKIFKKDNNTNTYRWREDLLKRLENEKETKAFSFIKDFADAVAEYKFSQPNEQRTDEPWLVYEDYPTKNVFSEIPGSDFKDDGFFKLGRSSIDPEFGRLLSNLRTTVAAADIVVVAEYKRKLDPKNLFDNRSKLLSAANHIMSDDPRRSFMFGITIEGSRMSLWYFSRSHSTKSEDFDFIEQPMKVISIFLSFLFGKPARLGFDKAVRRYKSDHKIHYEYQVAFEGGDRYFRTVKSLFSYRPNRITGRMTRVWQVVEIDAFKGNKISDQEFALKDVWLDSDAPTEKKIQQDIFDAVEAEKTKRKGGKASSLDYIESWDTEQRDKLENLLENGEYRNLFMKIECESVGGCTTRGKPDVATPDPGLLKAGTKGSVKWRSRMLGGADRSRDSPGPISASSTSSDGNTHRTKRNANPRSYTSKKRYLLVFGEVGSALHQLKSFKDVFKALRDITYALAVMYIAGWVHRDVSIGNIIVVESGGSLCGKLSDLEFARVFGPRSQVARDPKTGTPFFMAHEYVSGTWLWNPDIDQNREGPIDKIRKRNKQSQGDSPSAEQVIVYNFQYDLESVCARHKVFTKAKHLPSVLESKLHEKLKPLLDFIVSARDALYLEYVDREKKDKVTDPVTYSEICLLMLITVEDCLKACMENQDLPSFTPSGYATNDSLSTATPGTSSKRPPSQRPDNDSSNEAGPSSPKRARALVPEGFLHHNAPDA